MTLISFIVTGRNDNYGGRFIERMNNFISSIAILSNRHNIDSEIVITEWNPQPEKPFLWQEIYNTNKILKKYKQKIKFIIVPNNIHNTFRNRDDPNRQIPVLDYAGKNVGIRRSSGQFLLICSPDLIFQDDFFIKLKNNFFTNKYIYRSARTDYHSINLELDDDNIKYDDFINKCKENSYAVHTEANTPINNDSDRMYPFPPFGNASGDFLLTHRDNWLQIQGCPERTDIFSYIDSRVLDKHLAISEQWVLNLNCSVLHENHGRFHYTGEDEVKIQQLITHINHENWGLNNTQLESISFNY